jgi:bla regulator protein blaR1
MIAQILSDLWKSLAPPLGNHLWQSTLFAAVAGLLTLLLRKNSAGTRYWLWMAASLKFLLPFSLLVTIGSYASRRHSVANSTGDFYLVMDSVSQPFSHGSPSVATHASVLANLTQMLPAILAAVWLFGFVAVLYTWLARWRRISTAMRAAMPVQEGREVNALRRLEQAGGVRRGISLLLSRSSLEPGIFGIAHPVLVWPEGISDRLEDAHIEAIMAHEIWHVRRRDNLAAAFHMLVEAIFWFHPLVWWLGARLVEERERACDEEVLQLGNPPQIYAESILKICEFCVGSPLACVSGVTGADLKKRIVYIMNERFTRKLDLTRKLLLTTAGIMAITVPVIFGLLRPAQSRAQAPAQPGVAASPGFESVSIKLNKTGEAMPPFKIVSNPPGKGVGVMFNGNEFKATNATLRFLVKWAYNVEDFQISGNSEALDSDRYDVIATFSGPRSQEVSESMKDQRRQLLQALLADNFKLVLHRETRDVPAYVMSVGKNGPKFDEAKPGNQYLDGLKASDGSPAGPHRMTIRKIAGYRELEVQALPVENLARLFSDYLDRSVVDRTGLTGEYDLKLVLPENFTKTTSSEAFAAIEEQLGLKIDPQLTPKEFLTIDRAEKPQFN